MTTIKYYITDDAARLTFTHGRSVTAFSIVRNDWMKLVNSGNYVEHCETNMIVNEDMNLKTWEKDGNRFIYFKFFESSIHTSLSYEADQTLWLFFDSICKQWTN